MSEDEVQYEQYLDFLRNRTFRRTLLGRNDVSLQRSWSGAQFRELFLSSRSQQDDEQESLVDPKVIARFRNPRGSILSPSTPLLKGPPAPLATRPPAPL